MRKFMAGVIAGAILMGASHVVAQGHERTYMVFGHGTSSCGTWVDEVTNNSSGDPYPFTAWVNGYITGIGTAYTASKRGELQRTDAAAMRTWVSNYCAAHPMDTIENAGWNLFVDLSR